MNNPRKEKKKVSKVSVALDQLSEYLAPRKGLIPIIGMGLILLNLLIQFLFYGSWIANTNIFLHLGVLTAIFGLMLARAL